jgi:hypothetical protein
MIGMRLKFGVLFLLGAVQFCAADVTFLRTLVADIQQGPPAYAGDPDEKQLKSVARYGELTVDPGGRSETVSYAAQEQIYYLLDGNGVLLLRGPRRALDER